MDTKAPTTPAPEKKPRKTRADAGKPKFEYYISLGGIPCRLEHFPTLIKKPIYVPCKPGEALHIVGSGSSSRRKGKRMAIRCEKLRSAFLKAIANPLFTVTTAMSEAKAMLLAGEYQVEKRKVAIESAGTQG